MKLRHYREKGGTILRTEVILTKREQKVWYKDCLKRIFDNPRWYLDNLKYLPEFQVDWLDYHKNHYNRDYKRKKSIRRMINGNIYKELYSDITL